MSEIWKDIPSFSRTHEASTLGRIRNKITNRVVAGAFHKASGYRRVNISSGGVVRNKKVSGLVAETFIGPRPPDAHVNHIDCNKMNDRVENLEYASPLENMRHAARNGLMQWGKAHYSAKLTEREVRIIPKLVACGLSMPEIGRCFNVGKTAIRKALTGKSWKGMGRAAI